MCRDVSGLAIDSIDLWLKDTGFYSLKLVKQILTAHIWRKDEIEVKKCTIKRGFIYLGNSIRILQDVMKYKHVPNKIQHQKWQHYLYISHNVFQTGWLITLSMIGKLSITASYSTIYIFTAEIFPTPIRNVGIGCASMSARYFCYSTFLNATLIRRTSMNTFDLYLHLM